MLKKSHYIALGVVALLALIVLNLPGRASGQLKLAIGSLFLPLFGLTGASQQVAGKSADALLPRSELVRENAFLRRNNQQLRVQVQQDQEIARENSRLHRLLGWRDQSPWKDRLRPAHIVLREPANWWRSAWIDLGRRDHLAENLPVLAPDGCLVGRVVSVGQIRSQVVLVGDPSCRVAAWVENETHERETGIIGSSGPLDSSLVEMRLFRNTVLKPGQNVLTSGLGGIFPSGILIGRIVDTQAGEYGRAEARVKPAADLATLEEVWVLFP